MPKFTQDQAILINAETGREVEPGRMVVGFRGETYRFDYISQLPGWPSMGKVVASQPCGHKVAQDHSVLCTSGWFPREMYPKVLYGRIIVVEERP